MIETGEVLENTQSGESVRVRTSRRDSAGKLVEGDFLLAAGGAVAAAHLHPKQVETFEVVEGEVFIRIGDQEVRAVPGKKHVVPPGVAHRLHNRGERDAKLLSAAEPALRMDEVLETFWGLATDGKTNRFGHPSPLRAAAVLAEFREDFRLSWPAPWIQDLIFRPLRPIARALGIPGTYVPVSRRRLRTPKPVVAR